MFGWLCWLLLADHKFGTGGIVFTGGEVKQLSVATREWNPVMNDPPTIFFFRMYTRYWILLQTVTWDVGVDSIEREREDGTIS
jgi:hypothetical protein